MLNTVKTKAVSVKNHVVRHRGKYAAGATFIVMLKLQLHTAAQINQFLAEKGIDPMEYYCPEYFAELNS